MEYDFVIVGMGPTALTLMHALTRMRKSCLLVYETEEPETHSFVYSQAFVNFYAMFARLGIKESFYLRSLPTDQDTTKAFFYDYLFVGCENAFSSACWKIIVYPGYGRTVSCHDHFASLNLNEKAQKRINRFIKWLTIGSDAKQMSLHDFLQIYNHRLLDGLQVEKLQDERTWSDKWLAVLQKRTPLLVATRSDPTITLERVHLTPNNKRVSTVVLSNGETIHVKHDLILTVPFSCLHQMSEKLEVVGNLLQTLGRRYIKNHTSTPQTTVVFTFVNKITFPVTHNHFQTFGEWELKIVGLSVDKLSMRVVVTNTTEFDRIGLDQLKTTGTEIMRQIMIKFPSFQQHTWMFEIESKNQTTFVHTSNNTDNKNERECLSITPNPNISNLHVVGSHTLSHYQGSSPFVSVETSVVSALEFLRDRFAHHHHHHHNNTLRQSRHSTRFQTTRYRLFLLVLFILLAIIAILVGVL